MRRHLCLGHAPLAAALVLTVGCVDSPITPTLDPTPQFANGDGRGGGPGGGGDDPAPAELTFRDAASDGVYGDSLGSYVDGSERVDVAITADDFHFKPRTHRKGARSIWVALTEIPGGDADPFGGTPQELGQATDLRINGGLCAAANGDTAPARLLWYPEGTGGGPHYNLNFGNDDGGDPLTITRADHADESSTWTATSDGSSTLELNGAHQGTFGVAFQITVTGSC